MSTPDCQPPWIHTWQAIKLLDENRELRQKLAKRKWHLRQANKSLAMWSRIARGEMAHTTYWRHRAAAAEIGLNGYRRSWLVRLAAYIARVNR